MAEIDYEALARRVEKARDEAVLWSEKHPHGEHATFAGEIRALGRERDALREEARDLNAINDLREAAYERARRQWQATHKTASWPDLGDLTTWLLEQLEGARETCEAAIEELNDLRAEVERLRNEIDCACNALTDSICVSGNDRETNLAWVRKLRRVPVPPPRDASPEACGIEPERVLAAEKQAAEGKTVPWEELRAELAGPALEELDRLRRALTPSAETKRAYIGEVEGVTWTQIKEVMVLIHKEAGIDLAPTWPGPRDPDLDQHVLGHDEACVDWCRACSHRIAMGLPPDHLFPHQVTAQESAPAAAQEVE